MDEVVLTREERAQMEIEGLAARFIDEFAAHLEEYRLRGNPDADRRVVFEAWVIHKIATIAYLMGDRLAWLDASGKTG